MKRTLSLGLVLVALFMGAVSGPNAAISPDDVPPELSRWQSWVLYGSESSLCPCRYNDGDTVQCHWPSRLELEVSADGGRFEQRWLIFSEGWVALPGGREAWPESVAVDGRPAAVVPRGEVPSVRLTPGEHHVAGRFFWSRLPEMMAVPPSLGLISLVMDGREIHAPVIDAQGRLWLQKSPGKDSLRDTVKVKVFRLLDDTIPMQVTTLLRLDVSGKAREITLDGALLPGATPMALESPLPARISDEGRLSVQARAGQWEVRVIARLAGPQFKISAGPCPHGDEIWSFQPRHALRIVDVEDLPPVEPGQTEMPDEWRSFQAFLVKPESVMVIKELRRGDPDPAPDQLSLRRTWWLDFNGKGFTVHDTISGVVSRQWYLAMNPPMTLGRVAVDGLDRVITQQGPDKLSGVELRHGRLDLQADARIPAASGPMPAVGWDHDFQSVAGTLHLPPGWRLLATAGVDSVSDTWLQRWSLFDFFVVLIITLAIYRLRSPGWGGVALAAMILIYHEPGAPRLVWLHLLAVLALLPLLPGGWFKRLVALWGIGATIVLLAMAVPFVIQQIRWGVYPQLAPAYTDYDSGFIGDGLVAKREYAEIPETSSVLMDDEERRAPGSMPRVKASKSLAMPEQAPEEPLPQQDPDALIPTGPGLPDWRWQSIDMGWSGPVAGAQTLKLYLLSPMANLLLALARVALLVLLIWVMIDWRAWWQRLQQRMGVATAALLVMGAMAALQPAPSMAAATDFPPPALLDELRQRLLEKPDCLPDCADISRMEVVVSSDQLQVLLKVNAAQRVAVPLPVRRKSWSPDQILLDNAPMGGLARDTGGQLWGLVPEGLHTVVLLGDIGQEALIQIPLPLPPHGATYSAQGWRVDGIQADGSVGSSIQLSRLQTDEHQAAGVRGSVLPPFLKVERVLHLGLTWHTTTTVTRLTPTGTPVVVNIPLLAGESVTTAAIAVEQGQALVNMAPDQQVLTYEAGLEIVPRIELKAPRAVPWTETWVLDASPVWHCEMEGIAAVHHQDAAGQWRPQWQPWPEETVTLRIQRPAAVAGQTKTIDRAELVLTPGARFGQGQLALTLRTSRGGQHTITLPPKANLQEVTLDGRSLPVRQDNALVGVPLPPGQHRIAVRWHQLAAFKSWFQAPPVGIGQAAVNARITVEMPDQRWILMAGGPRWGPAVLFWSYLAAIVLAALVLGRLALTPLKTWQWVLLGLGLTQIPTPLVLVIVGWLLALGVRHRQSMPRHWLPFNGVQILLAIWTVAALAALFAAVKSGLLGAPEMQIAGNESTWRTLHWTQDHVAESLPRPWVLSLPVWVYRILMLVWSLWLVWSLLAWFKWGWQCITENGGWRRIVLRRGKAAAAGEGGRLQDESGELQDESGKMKDES